MSGSLAAPVAEGAGHDDGRGGGRSTRVGQRRTTDDKADDRSGGGQAPVKVGSSHERGDPVGLRGAFARAR